MFKAYDIDQNIIFVGETTPRHDGKTLCVIVSSSTDISPLQSADRVDVYLPGSEDRVAESYKVVCWKSVERLWDGIRVTWQTYAPDELETMQENLNEMQKALAASEARVEMLTNALLDLAGVVGNRGENTNGSGQSESTGDSSSELPAEDAEKPKRTRRKKEAEGENA